MIVKTKLVAFHGKQSIKDEYLARVRAHKAADEIIHGKYWEKGKGCAVGCTVHSEHHSAYENELGIPIILARLEDGIFEGLKPPRDIEWPEQFLDAIPVGADLSNICPQFAIWLLIDEEWGAAANAYDAANANADAAVNAAVNAAAAINAVATYNTTTQKVRNAQADKLLELIKEAPRGIQK